MATVLPLANPKIIGSQATNSFEPSVGTICSGVKVQSATVETQLTQAVLSSTMPAAVG